MRSVPLLVALVLAVLLQSGGLRAAVLVDTLKARQARIDVILAKYPDELPPAARTEVANAISEQFDFVAMGRSAIGEQWAERSEAERKAYLDAFEALVRANILRRVDIYRTESIEYQKETIAGDRGQAHSVVKSKSATTEVVYDLVLVDGKWRIVDYSIDGISAVKNYRSQFAKLLEKRGWTGLVERLRKRKEEIESGK